MRTIRRTAAFKLDYRREKEGRFGETLDADLDKVLAELAADGTLDRRHHDHALTWPWKDLRCCNVIPDLFMIYSKPDSDHVDLVRLGLHSDLSL